MDGYTSGTTDSGAWLVLTAVETASLLAGTLELLRDVTEQIYRAANKPSEQDADGTIPAVEADDWVLRLDVLGNVMGHANDELLKALRKSGQAVMLPRGSVVTRDPCFYGN